MGSKQRSEGKARHKEITSRKEDKNLVKRSLAVEALF